MRKHSESHLQERILSVKSKETKHEDVYMRFTRRLLLKQETSRQLDRWLKN